MKKLLILVMSLTAITSFASNYPGDYCRANVTVCEDGPAVVAQVSSGCNSGVYVIGYKKNGSLGSNSFIDAVVSFNYGNSTVRADYRITPDWNNLGFLTAGIDVWNVRGRVESGSLADIAIAFSNGYGAWDSKDGANYHFAMNERESHKCYRVKTNEDFTSQIPYSAWNVINEAMSRNN